MALPPLPAWMVSQVLRPTDLSSCRVGGLASSNLPEM